MISIIKRILYFPVAYYFRFFAKIQLEIWKPKIVVITGSTGKTTLLHLIESQIKGQARYSHHANSSYGIPFDILGLGRKSLEIAEWPYLFLAAPFKAFKKTFQEKLYIVETDCDRPKEGKFLASFLKPEITLWISSSRTHTINFDHLVSEKKFRSVEEAIAFEFGYFLEYSKNLIIVNGDSKFITDQLTRTKTIKKLITKKQLKSYTISKKSSVFEIDNQKYLIPYIMPEENFYAIAMTKMLVNHLGKDLNPKFPGFNLPPGRSSLFKGIKNTNIIDSSYNATPASIKVILGMFKKYPAEKKWLILGDMIELGEEEKEEHEELAPLIRLIDAQRIILVGPRLSKYTYPKLASLKNTIIEKFDGPKEALDFLKSNIQGGETLLFKGARFLEGVIEHLLLNKSDISKLCRREKVWEDRRRKWEL